MVLVLCAVLSDISSFAIISLGKRGCFTLICHVTDSMSCLFLTVLLVDIQYVIVAFLTYLFIDSCLALYKSESL